VYAAGVWESKPFADWTDKETQAVLSDSPWAGKGALTNVRSGGSFSPVPDWKVIVTWRTALPIRQALVRRQIGQGGKVMADQQATLTVDEPNYIVMIEGVPAMYAAMMQTIGPLTSLQREGKPPIMAVQGATEVRDKEGNVIAAPAAPPAPAPSAAGGATGRGGRGGFTPVKDDGSTATLMFGFPRTDPITTADKEVEFSTTLGAYHLKKKFRVKDMVINGEPAL
jgi:hypothetical protein